ncbi:MAG: bifunctional DNA-formamidopyrimidine glycosylase/DNA-(apurinic or apyrimidinic site) lyase [Parvibaculum sp.]|uniref:bifunctional DNA-formamidopyrimidine glycosylase/DNA-(apurinic or apyrimidinic site) lyase n=1 Tax=Parvibaculum sp. TaxID=2024848 RepID=UPI0025DD2C82|nr:bifunctional DNA-formamidopyrimidine glycosylase/DNA-(apurinic or apyrimidinic site) lyase [Parvibaculum sp.]MCE9648222.1 bifunctional DNA-formamidopyrimidine glycosylase/DNA-(apurinic or apyrimidinic site) lyase [Parvibaculum sp.]
MPELPEVETVRRGLAPVLEGRRIARAIQLRANLRYMLPDRFAERLTGRRVERLERRAKYILAHLEGGEVLLIHLGMSGRFIIHAGDADPKRPGRFHYEAADAGTQTHDHIVFDMEDGTRIVYSDHRRFGFMDLIAENMLEANPHLAALGPEPLGNEFSAEVLGERLKGRRAPIKAALLDQRTVAGLGNIYVCEALFRSGISPAREAGRIGAARVEKLARAIRDVLTEAIEAGGSTLRDYARTDGELGYFQHSFATYDREGEACSKPRCGGTVKRTVQSGRSTFYCPSCQR